MPENPPKSSKVSALNRFMPYQAVNPPLGPITPEPQKWPKEREVLIWEAEGITRRKL
jgi:hypothetical protein